MKAINYIQGVAAAIVQDHGKTIKAAIDKAVEAWKKAYEGKNYGELSEGDQLTTAFVPDLVIEGEADTAFSFRDHYCSSEKSWIGFEVTFDITFNVVELLEGKEFNPDAFASVCCLVIGKRRILIDQLDYDELRELDVELDEMLLCHLDMSDYGSKNA